MTARSVEREGKKADEMIRKLAGEPADAAAAETDQPTRKEAAPEPQDPATGTEVQPDSAGIEHDWKKRFSSLSSTHASTVAELKQAQAAAKQRESELLERLEALEQKPNDRSYLSEDELTLFGEDNLNVVERVAEQMAERKLAVLQQQQERERERAEAERQAQIAATERHTTFKQQLKNAVEDFDRIDNDKGFEAWLKAPDMYSGVPRVELLQRAYQSSDVGRVAQFYRDYVSETRKPDPRENLVQPRQSGAPAPDGPTPKGRIWTEADRKKFYHDKAMGRFQNDPETARALENDLFAAMREGRIRR